MIKGNIEKRIKEFVASKLSDLEGINNLDYDIPLFSLGIDSISALFNFVKEMFDSKINVEGLNTDCVRSKNHFADLIGAYLE